MADGTEPDEWQVSATRAADIHDLEQIRAAQAAKKPTESRTTDGTDPAS